MVPEAFCFNLGHDHGQLPYSRAFSNASLLDGVDGLKGQAVKAEPEQDREAMEREMQERKLAMDVTMCS